jgi:hypothetical protein
MAEQYLIVRGGSNYCLTLELIMFLKYLVFGLRWVWVVGYPVRRIWRSWVTAICILAPHPARTLR